MPRLLIAVTFFAAALVLTFGYARPEWRKFKTIESEITELEEIGREFDELISSRDHLLERINAVSKEDLARLERLLPSGAHAADFLTALEGIAVEGGIALRRIDLASPESAKAESSLSQPGTSARQQPRPAAAPVSAPEAGKTGIVPFSAQVSGSYPAFKKFLAGLERNTRLIDVEEISFSSGGKAEIIDFTVKAKTYYQ